MPRMFENHLVYQSCGTDPYLTGIVKRHLGLSGNGLSSARIAKSWFAGQCGAVEAMGRRNFPEAVLVLVNYALTQHEDWLTSRALSSRDHIRLFNTLFLRQTCIHSSRCAVFAAVYTAIMQSLAR
ncbi:hypothetical protein HBH56_176310 [Parastagonospora nodorum]|uniref:Uncharacterized protein n=1 Tax=Phaeosphaeria nodorum (strain SN15 / ATCC MYA-4574 / FGSC 10173) TaxID=321614 RepID=A0A7U2F3W1_PHANO|nr:hypothetical protein HBH56_176310 [Parastagonospora nodorum]QRC96200.1 hypothetical protein JI435_408410 [Parastagonospora nodorum SN15]KAH3926484.1 hypothetical protein HBH54_166850 [Parastagonospora nodorum]KAH3939096.1 hypothetical protein HBH53_240070 [Parastagonospora nodorum]KAH3965683.1 hypothetical protein HBH52_203490 [Parastagonospora nodorum]